MAASPRARLVARRSRVALTTCAAAVLGAASALLASAQTPAPSAPAGLAAVLRTPPATGAPALPAVDSIGPQAADLARPPVVDDMRPGAAELADTPATPRTTPSATPSPSATPALQAPGVNVPVLLYHYVRIAQACDTVGQGLSVAPSTFNAQMTMLQLAGFNVISLDTLMGAVLSRAPLPPHPVVLTFDDGYADFATAAVPILLAHAMTATDFVVPGFMGRPSYMTAEQVVAVHAAGMTVAGHTLHHVALAHQSTATAAAEILGSRLALEQLIGAPVPDFAYPYGDFNAGVEHLVATAGFREAFTTQWGIHQAAAYRFALPRLRVGNSVYYMASELGISGSVAQAAVAHPGPLPAGEDPRSAPPPSACHVARPTPAPVVTLAPVTRAAVRTVQLGHWF